MTEISENFIAWLWKFRILGSQFILRNGEQLTVYSTGEPNQDGGPDFFNTRIRIGDTIWAGNAEIHVHSADWYRHGHQDNISYRNAILHIVYEDNSPVFYSNGTPMPTLEIKELIPNRLVEKYRSIITGGQWIPCYNQLKEIPGFDIQSWAKDLVREKLILKADHIRKLWESCLYNWDEAFYRQLAWCFGFRVNNTAFEILAKSIPLKIIQQNSNNQLSLEAILYGQAGMLERNFAEEYPEKLKQEYLHFRAKYKLSPHHSAVWNFLRMRPCNFPTIRISQWGNLLHQTGGKFFQLLEHGDIPDIFKENSIVTSEYWFNHFTFEKTSVFTRKYLGKESINLLLINGMAPFLFFYGFEKDLPAFREKALGLLSRINPESNNVISRWKSAGINCENALQSQALLHLKKFYCENKRCLDCRIGTMLLNG